MWRSARVTTPLHRMMSTVSSSAALRLLNLDRATATPEKLKSSFKELAKQWHPDRHQGINKVSAEAKFKELQQAYQMLSEPGALHRAVRGESSSTGTYTGTNTGTYSGRRRGAAYQDGRYREPEEREHLWGERFGPASRPGYNPHTGYMGFGGKNPNGKNHFYEDTAAAAENKERMHMYRSWGGFLVFALGLGTVYYTSRVSTRALRTHAHARTRARTRTHTHAHLPACPPAYLSARAAEQPRQNWRVS